MPTGETSPQVWQLLPDGAAAYATKPAGGVTDVSLELHPLKQPQRHSGDSSRRSSQDSQVQQA